MRALRCYAVRATISSIHAYRNITDGTRHTLRVMPPHPEDVQYPLFPKHLIHQAMLNGDAAGVCAAQVSGKFFGLR
jgi:hypothetical protein